MYKVLAMNLLLKTILVGRIFIWLFLDGIRQGGLVIYKKNSNLLRPNPYVNGQIKIITGKW